MDRQTFKLLLVHEEFKDIVQYYIDQSDALDGELVDVFYGSDYSRGRNDPITRLFLKSSQKFNGDAEIKLGEENRLVLDALELWAGRTNLPFVVNGFERVDVTSKGRNESVDPMGLFWLVEVRTK